MIFTLSVAAWMTSSWMFDAASLQERRLWQLGLGARKVSELTRMAVRVTINPERGQIGMVSKIVAQLIMANCYVEKIWLFFKS